MECLRQTTLTQEARYLEFVQKLRQYRIPVSGNIEITRRCNFDCIHCYLGDMKRSQDMISRELDTLTWKNLIDEIADAGCLFLLFTGGEPLLRSDFIDIYRHAVMRGMVVTVFTNGSMISDEILDCFSQYPPQVVEITIYGATPSTYEAVTGCSDGLEKVMAGIEKLVGHGIRTRVKTILMKKNQHEFERLEKIAEDYGLKFRFDAMIFPRLNGDLSPIGLRVSPETVVKKHLSSKDRRLKWDAFYRRMKHVKISRDLYACGAGATNFHIDPAGVLSPCVMISQVTYDLLHGSFLSGWKYIQRIKEKKIPLEFECNNCDKHVLCGYCPAFFKLETGSDTRVSPYVCEIGHRMYDALSLYDETGDEEYGEKEQKKPAAL